PYRWSLQTGRLPAGLGLKRSGAIGGAPRPSDRRGTFALTVRVTDAVGQSATRKLVLRVR
ncbi:MAG: Ig domain-containing protein, partial [Gaiellaceae bacterium]